MAKKSNLIALRNGIDDIYRQLLRDSGGEVVLNAAILESVKSKMHDEISALNAELVDRSLIKLVNDVSSRTGKSAGMHRGRDLFGEYQGIPQSFSVGRGQKRPTIDLPLSDLSRIIEAYDKKKVGDKYKELRQAIAECKSLGASDSDTLGAAMERLPSRKQAELELETKGPA